MTVTELADYRARHRHSTAAPPVDDVWSRTWLAEDRVWEVQHVPTGLTERFCEVTEMAGWTCDEPAALDDLRRIARALVVETFALQSERDRGSRALMLLADPPTLLPYNTSPDLIETRCVCGGFLAARPGRELTHVDICVWCLHGPGEPCPEDRNTHQVCDRPAPAVCDHQRCSAPSRVFAQPCLLGKEICCSCCYGGAA